MTCQPKFLKMVNIKHLLDRDLKHVWHPCSQMKDFESCPPLVIEQAQGCYLYTDQGPLIDAISSWWCKSLGHGHPQVIAAIKKQLQQFEHVISANTTHPALIELAEELAQLTGKQHIFFASDGACAVEIAMKLAIHSCQIKGYSDKNQFIALKNGYHGETLGAMSVSDLGLYKAPYEGFGVTCHFIDDIPYVSGKQDPLWSNCEAHWLKIEPYLDTLAEQVCAIIVEPIVQGASGMLCYSADFLQRISLWAQSKNILLIADEIMTGVGRTGEFLACNHADVQADLICLSKGLTSGSLPLSCVMLDHSIYELFYDDYSTGKSFLHSHTYSGNPLAVCAALATIKTIKNEHILNNVSTISGFMLEQMQEVAYHSGQLNQVRGIGAIVAADLNPVGNYRIGNEVYEQALKQGALIRPIGTSLYWMPPLNCDKEIIGKIAKITLNSIEAAYNKAQKNA